ncbi:hypothetical protein LZ30DRAFT_59431 [Colletotrichum cereale]|nr:hypothetical protein LZ30DRAFT_59431 [Colletotrichum cereale]
MGWLLSSQPKGERLAWPANMIKRLLPLGSIATRPALGAAFARLRELREAFHNLIMLCSCKTQVGDTFPILRSCGRVFVCGEQQHGINQSLEPWQWQWFGQAPQAPLTLQTLTSVQKTEADILSVLPEMMNNDPHDPEQFTALEHPPCNQSPADGPDIRLYRYIRQIKIHPH